MVSLAWRWRRDIEWPVLCAACLLAGCSNSTSHDVDASNDQDGSTAETGITVMVYPCPTIASLSAAPSSIDPDGAAAVAVATMVPDGGALLWTASSGSFSDAGASATLYWCAMPGSATLTATVTYDLCKTSQSVSVACVAR